MGQPARASAGESTLGREWGRLRRLQLMYQLRASGQPGQSPLELELLRAVTEAGEIRASDLASQLLVTKTSISRYVNAMLKERLLLQRPDPSDGRATLLSVSAGGRRALAQREARRAAMLDELCQDWPEHEVATLTRLLQRLNEVMESRMNQGGRT